jgi:hypothetical protein
MFVFIETSDVKILFKNQFIKKLAGGLVANTRSLTTASRFRYNGFRARPTPTRIFYANTITEFIPLDDHDGICIFAG